MAISTRNEGAKVNSNINVTPMVDVMLVLLIIFMVITPMLQNGVSVDLAQVNNPERMPDAEKEDAMVVSVMRDGTVYFRSDKIPVDQLTQKVKDRLASQQDKRVYVKADARAKFGAVVDGSEKDRPRGSTTPACWRTIRAFGGYLYEYGSWLRRRSERGHERDSADRRASCVDYYFHGHQPSSTQGT
jgi:biopolymer transport protein ExbD/biopolymer transport protein TolR